MLSLNNVISICAGHTERQGPHYSFSKRARTAFLSITLIFIFMLSACASTEDVGKVQHGVIKLDKEMEELKRRSQIIEKEIPRSQQQLKSQLEGTKDSQEATARAVSNLFIKVQDFSGELQQITGSIEEIRHLSENNLKEETKKRELLSAEVSGIEVLLQDLKARLESIKTEMEEVMAGMEGIKTEIKGVKTEMKEVKTGMKGINVRVDEIREEQDFAGKKLVRMEQRRIPPKKNIKKTAKSGKAEPAKKKAKADVKNIYSAANDLHKAGKYEEARLKFMSVLQDYEENEHSDDSRYYVGDCYFMERKYEDSIIAFEEFLKDTKSEKVSAARLRQGLAFYEIDDPDTGAYILKNLTEMFPDSTDAILARKKLGISADTTKENE